MQLKRGAHRELARRNAETMNERYFASLHCPLQRGLSMSVLRFTGFRVGFVFFMGQVVDSISN